jgi:hypothetical protein
MCTTYGDADGYRYHTPPDIHVYTHSDAYGYRYREADGHAHLPTHIYINTNAHAGKADRHADADVSSHVYSNARTGETNGDADERAHLDAHAYGYRYNTDAYAAKTDGDANGYRYHVHAYGYRYNSNAHAATTDSDVNRHVHTDLCTCIYLHPHPYTHIHPHAYSCCPVSRVEGYGGDGSVLGDAISFGCYGDCHLNAHTAAHSHR